MAQKVKDNRPAGTEKHRLWSLALYCDWFKVTQEDSHLADKIVSGGDITKVGDDIAWLTISQINRLNEQIFCLRMLIWITKKMKFILLCN